MKFDRIRSLWKKLTPVVLAGAFLGGGGALAAKHYFAADCCAQGSACCHPGSPCCHGHGASNGVAAR